MNLDPVVLALGAMFAAVILFVLGLEAAFFNQSGVARDNANRRMRMVQDGASTNDIINQLRRKSRNQSPFLGPIGHAYSHLDYLITQAGLMVPTGRVLLVMVGSALSLLFSSPLKRKTAKRQG